MHTGNILAEKNGYKIIDCEICGFKHLDPIPSEAEINEFYKTKYFNLIKKGGRAPEIKRLMMNDKNAQSERNWLKSTLYSDISYFLSQSLTEQSRKICDVGCGTGDLLKHMKNNGWEVFGIEPSEEGAHHASDGDVLIYNQTIAVFIEKNPELIQSFDAVTMINVLEHVPDPKTILIQAKNLLKPRIGIICVRVPNDFNSLQKSAQVKLHEDPWWIAIPDHINYFSVRSLIMLIESVGFGIISTISDFPMEFLLLMGENYIGKPDIGDLCHKRRISFETSIPDELRRNMYACFSKNDIGRTCMIFAKVK